jgi:hypothetical protein
LKLDLLRRLQAARAAKRPVALLTRLPDGAQLLFPEDPVPAALADAARAAILADAARNVATDDETWFVEPHNPPLRLIVVGAVHIAQALVPMAAGLGFAVALAKKSDFVGRAALEKAKTEGPKRKLITLTVDAPVQLYGGESIVLAGKVVGVTSSAGWGHTIGKAVAFGYVPAEAAGQADYEIEAFTKRWPAKRIEGSAVDPKRTKILA